MDAVLSMRTKTVNFATTLREARRFASAELRGIDTETVSVVSAIALDETTLRNARQLSAAELRDIDIVEVSIVRTAYFDKIRT